MAASFEHILLEQEQRELLEKLVEASRNVARDQRKMFMLNSSKEGIFVAHPGLPGHKLTVYEGDLDTLVSQGLLTVKYGPRGTPRCDVTPLGFRYYEYLKGQITQPTQRFEAHVRAYLEGSSFRDKYPAAYQKWSEAETLLWGANTDSQLTTIGHLCREAIQEFATYLVDGHNPPNIDSDRAHTVARIGAVINYCNANTGDAQKDFLDALVAYWRAVSNLVQRQEHGGQKEGRSLKWEDGRRVVFQTAIVMFEVSCSLG